MKTAEEDAKDKKFTDITELRGKIIDKENAVNGIREHLHEIEQTAKTRMNDLMPMLKAQAGVTEKLKAQNQMLWVAKMNSLQNQAEEMILSELIYN